MRTFIRKWRRVILVTLVTVIVSVGLFSGVLAATLENILITYVPYTEPARDVPPTLVTVITRADEGPPVELIGDVTDTGGLTVTKRGFVWSLQHYTDPGDTNPNETDYEHIWLEEGEFGLGRFGYFPPALELDIDYYGRAVACNDAGWGYGNEVIFDPVSVDSGSLLLRVLLRVLLAAVILLGVLQFSRLGGVAMLISAVIGLMTFGIIDVLVITLV